MRGAMPYPGSGTRTSTVLRTINASVPGRTSVFCFIVLTMHRHFGFQQEGCHTSFGKATGESRGKYDSAFAAYRRFRPVHGQAESYRQVPFSYACSSPALSPIHYPSPHTTFI